MPKTRRKKQSRKPIPLWGWGIIAIVFIAMAGFVILKEEGNFASSGYPKEISVSQAAEKRDQGAYILDVRQPEEWIQFHIPDATLIPLGDLPSRLNEVPKDREVVVVCRTGHRSQQGRDILLNAGFTNVTSMAGGVTEWQSKGLPIATGQ